MYQAIDEAAHGRTYITPLIAKGLVNALMTQAITNSQPDMKVYVLLVDERPEEVTDFRRSVKAEVFYSSSDQPYENHIRVADTLIRMGGTVTEFEFAPQGLTTWSVDE